MCRVEGVFLRVLGNEGRQQIYKVRRGNLERGVNWNKIILWLLTPEQALLEQGYLSTNVSN